MTVAIRRLTLEDKPFLWEMLYRALYVPIGEPALSRDVIQDPDIARYVKDWGRSDDDRQPNVRFCHGETIAHSHA